MVSSRPLRAARTMLLASLLLIGSLAHATTVRLNTTQGTIEIALFDSAAPITVANFLAYVRSGAYSDSLIHRSVPGFIIQGGGYAWNSGTGAVEIIPPRAPIQNEFSASRSNLRGTIAMAKVGGDANSATSQWFISLADNAAILDGQNGGFTVFGQVSAASMAAVDAIAALPVVNEGSPFDTLPVTSLRTGNFYTKANLSLVHTAISAIAPGAIDIDGNGKHNIVLRSTSAGAAQMQVGRFDGSRFQFTPLDDPGANFRLVAVVDLDANGKSDLVFQNTTQGEFGDVRIWSNFQRSSERLWRQVKQVWDVQSAGDLDGDGNADLVWRYMAPDPRDTGVSFIWFYNGAAIPVVRKRGGAPLDWTLLGAGDFNNDGAADMVYISPNAEVRVLMATANRTCANFSAGIIPGNFRAVKLADFSGSGRGDMLIRNLLSGQNALRPLNATGLTLPPFAGNPDDPIVSCTATTQSLTIGNINLPQTDPSWRLYVTGDFNGDGLTDIVWQKPDGTLTLWLLNRGNIAPQIIDNAGSAPPGMSVFQSGGG